MDTAQKLTITPEIAAKMLGISKPKMYELCNQRGFPAIRIGRRIIIPIAGLEKWLAEQSTS